MANSPFQLYLESDAFKIGTAQTSINVPGNSSRADSMSYTPPNGYSIASITLSTSSGAGYAMLGHISDSSIYYIINNNGTSASTFTVSAKILYKKNS